ncbi:MAG: hypothetical protein WBC11_07175, partial [Dehalococcoidia bacterium]
AMKNSAPGLDASLAIRAAPPKINRVILLTSIPFLRATKLCASSWNINEAKNRKLVQSPTIQQASVDQSGYSSGKKYCARVTVIRKKIMNQD